MCCLPFSFNWAHNKYVLCNSHYNILCLNLYLLCIIFCRIITVRYAFVQWRYLISLSSICILQVFSCIAMNGKTLSSAGSWELLEGVRVLCWWCQVHQITMFDSTWHSCRQACRSLPACNDQLLWRGWLHVVESAVWVVFFTICLFFYSLLKCDGYWII